MAENYSVLAQSNPGAATLTDALTVAASTQIVVSSIVVANRAGAGTTFRISIAVAGAGDDNKQYIRYDKAIAANADEDVKVGITLAATDVVRVYATLATLSFNIFGAKIT